MFVLVSSLLLSVLLLPEPTRSYPFGAGACIPDGPSVMGPHLSSGEQAQFDDLYSVLINGSVMLTDSTAFLQGETYELTVIASTQMFKGALIRVQGSGDLEPGSNAKDASGCGDDAEGITHTGSDDKSDLSGFYTVGTSDSEIKIDVTVVESLAKYAHKQFVVSVEQAVIETVGAATTPAPVESLPMTPIPSTSSPISITPSPTMSFPTTEMPTALSPTTPGPMTEMPTTLSPTTASPTSLPPFEPRGMTSPPTPLAPEPSSMAPLSIMTTSPITTSTPVPMTTPIPVTTNPPVSIELLPVITESPIAPVILAPVGFFSAPPANIIPLSWTPPSSFMMTTTPPVVTDGTPIFTTESPATPVPLLAFSAAPTPANVPLFTSEPQPTPVGVPFPTIPLVWTPAPGGSSSTFDALTSGSANPLSVGVALALSCVLWTCCS